MFKRRPMESPKTRSQSQTEGSTPRLLVIDDDVLFRRMINLAFKDFFNMTFAANGDEAVDLMRSKTFDVVTLDISMRTRDEGLVFLPRLREISPDTPILMVSSHQEFEDVRTALTSGATDFYLKSSHYESLQLKLYQILKISRQQLITQSVLKDSGTLQAKHQLIGQSPTLQNLRERLEKFKKSRGNVLIFGEMGSGKEVIARQLRSQVAPNLLEPFVAIDSATLNQNLAESILFGHEKGAFTGADSLRKGLFEEANGGVVYFDEIGNLPLPIQSKLLRVLQEKEISRLGSQKTIPLDFRVIAATNRDLNREVKEHRFLPDLLERLEVLPIRVPPLREHKEDIPELVQYFLKSTRREALSIHDRALQQLMRYDWPGNVRELNSSLEYACTLCEGNELKLEHLPPKVFRDSGALDNASEENEVRSLLKLQERQLLENAYHEAGGNISKLAKKLKADRSHLFTKLTKMGIHVAKNPRKQEGIKQSTYL